MTTLLLLLLLFLLLLLPRYTAVAPFPLYTCVWLCTNESYYVRRQWTKNRMFSLNKLIFYGIFLWSVVGVDCSCCCCSCRPHCDFNRCHRWRRVCAIPLMDRNDVWCVCVWRTICVERIQRFAFGLVWGLFTLSCIGKQLSYPLNSIN